MRKILICLIIITQSALANELFISVDHTSFKNSDGKYFWELTYSFANNSVTYFENTDNETFYGEIQFQIEISSSSTILKNEKWVIPLSLDKNSVLEVMNLFGRKVFELNPGQYKAKLTATDVFGDDRVISTKFDFIVKSITQNDIELGGIMFAYQIQNVNETDIVYDKMFLRNNYYIIPNPSQEFVGTQPIIMGYFDIYNTDKFAAAGFQINYIVLDNAKREIAKFSYKHNDLRERNFSTFAFRLDTLPSGVYFLVTTLSYSASNNVHNVTNEKKFFIYNPEKPPQHRIFFTENELFEKSEFATINEIRIDEEFLKASVIAEPTEIDLFKTLTTLEAKQRFLFRFWYIRDSDTLTLVNETLQEFRRREEFANTFFNTGNFRSGWSSDRGKVLLKYGFWSTRDITEGHFGYNSYEEWFMEGVQGGVRFIFVDRQGNGHFRLVHSTARGEVYNENWYNDFVPSTRDIRQDDANPVPRHTPSPFGR